MLLIAPSTYYAHQARAHDPGVSESRPGAMLNLDAAKLRQVEDSVRRIFPSFNRPDHRALTDRGVESVRAALFPKYRLIPVMRRMSDDQQRILDILANRTRAAVRAPARPSSHWPRRRPSLGPARARCSSATTARSRTGCAARTRSPSATA